MSDTQENSIEFIPMTATHADHLSPRIAAVDPWHRLGISDRTIHRLLVANRPDHTYRCITWKGKAVGAIVVHQDWLLGPYLRHLSVAASARGQGIGAAAVEWLVQIAIERNQRNIWLCVSGFNIDAQRFYQRHGFEVAATLNQLVVESEDEILMRRRLERPQLAAKK